MGLRPPAYQVGDSALTGKRPYPAETPISTAAPDKSQKGTRERVQAFQLRLSRFLSEVVGRFSEGSRGGRVTSRRHADHQNR